MSIKIIEKPTIMFISNLQSTINVLKQLKNFKQQKPKALPIAKENIFLYNQKIYLIRKTKNWTI